MNKILSRNLRLIREHLKYSVEVISDFLDNSRYALYESGEEIDRISISEIENLSSLYGIEPYYLFESKFDPSKAIFRNLNLGINDMKEVSKFNSIVQEYIKICKL